MIATLLLEVRDGVVAGELRSFDSDRLLLFSLEFADESAEEFVKLGVVFDSVEVSM